MAFYDEKEEKKHNKNEEILWCDTDPNIKRSAALILKHGFTLKTFKETADCLFYIKNHKQQSHIKAIITSSMRRGGRKQKGLLDGLEMFNALSKNKITWKESIAPILAVVTAGALSIDECAERSIKIVSSLKERNNVRQYVQERVLHSLGAFDKNRKIMQMAFSSKPTKSCHDNRQECWKFLQSLLNKNGNIHFDSFGNHCFCSKCEKKTVYYRGNPAEKYVLPVGWYRFGINIRGDMNKGRLQMESWPVAYHGTPTDRVESIMEHQRIMFPGDTLNNGTKLPVRLNACFATRVSKDGKVIYCSPTIEYAGFQVYARPKTWRNGLCGQVAFQCRVKPKCYKKFPQTLKSLKTNFCAEISDNQIEWITADRTGIAPYAVLVKLSPQNQFIPRFVDK